MGGGKGSGEFNACVELLTQQGSFPAKCWSISASKFLSTCVILGAVGFKLPQIRLLNKNKSSNGLPMSQFVLEVCVSAITLSFNYHIGAPFSTYGESGFIWLQNIIIILQIRHYEKMSWLLFLCGAACYAGLVYGLYSDYARDLEVNVPFVDLRAGLDSFRYVNMRFQECLQVSNISRTTWGLNLAGSVIRVFTTFRELPDELIMQASFTISALLCFIVILQTFIYAKAGTGKAEKEKKTK